ncbi:MAG: hypothetical protein QNK29_02465 [Desulfobacterales bacterium]|nr:hypothetical protein [Desulfobacterales bacterium]
MTTFLVRLFGQNFLMDGKGGPRKKQFCATRLVDAEDPKQAETLALDFICKDSRLQNNVLNEVSDPPRINLESVIKISATAYDAQIRADALYWLDDDTKE